MIRVLHAEDDPQIAEIVHLLFERTAPECQIEHVSDGRSCLAAMQRGGFDVLLLDLMMPDTDGLHVLGELTARRDPTPVVMVSGQGEHELAIRALRAGAVDCINKNSADFRRIPEIARRVAERSRRQRAVMPPPREHEVLLIESYRPTQEEIEGFFAANSSRLVLKSLPPHELDAYLRSDFTCDAFVVGPGIQDEHMLDVLRRLRSVAEDKPAIVLSHTQSSATAIAAFQLGAHDFLPFDGSSLPDLVFSLNDALKRADTEKLNAQLSHALAELNRSLADQVTERTRDLESQIVVRKAAEQRTEENAARLQALSNRILRVQEDERHAIARELHDQVGQLLTGLRFQLEAAQNDRAALGEALSVTDELLRTVREMTLQLRPRMLDDLGLEPAIKWLVDRYRRQTSIQIELDLALPPQRLAPELEITAYRVVQEALNNVAKHSGAQTAVVTVAADDIALHVEISDRGRGFHPSEGLAKHNSLGLAGMTERVQLVGGQLEIVSQPSQGTRIHAEFSLTSVSARS